MSAEPARRGHLRPVEEIPEDPRLVVDQHTGETVPIEEVLQEWRDQLAGAESEIRSWRTKHANLKRDKEAEAEESPVWPAAMRVFNYWRQECNHPRSVFTFDRFELVRPFLEKYGDPKLQDPQRRLEDAEALCKRAVDGIAFDPFVTERANGTKKRHDGWHLIFGTADKFEERVNSAPRKPPEEVAPNDDRDDGGPEGPAEGEGASQGEQDSLWPGADQAPAAGG